MGNEHLQLHPAPDPGILLNYTKKARNRGDFSNGELPVRSMLLPGCRTQVTG